jgi:parvulin-like peptidyl-prolyl isomerase
MMTARIMVLMVVFWILTAFVASAEEINPVVGKSGAVSLRESDLKRLISYQSPEVQKKLQDEPEQRVILVRQLLTTNAIATKARSEGFDKKPEVMEQLGYLIDQFLAQEYLVKVVTTSVTVPDEDLKRYYKEHQQVFLLPEKITARHIFIEVSKESGPEEKAKAQARADGILLRLKKGEDFDKLAKEMSDDADTAAKGGALGVIAPGKTNSEEFEKAAFALKSGEISAVVATPFGYHIIKVDERQEQRTASFEEAREYITLILKRELEQKKAQEFMEKTMKEAGVEVFAEKITGVKKENIGKEGK